MPLQQPRLHACASCSVVLLQALNPAFSSAVISFCSGFEPIQHDLRVTDEADGSVVLAEL